MFTDAMLEQVRKVKETASRVEFTVIGGEPFVQHIDDLMINIDPLAPQTEGYAHVVRVFSLDWRDRYLDALGLQFVPEPLSDAFNMRRFTVYFQHETAAMFYLEKGIPYTFTMTVHGGFPEAQLTDQLNRGFMELVLLHPIQQVIDFRTVSQHCNIHIMKTGGENQYTVKISPDFPSYGAEMTLVNDAGDIEIAELTDSSFSFSNIYPGKYTAKMALKPSRNWIEDQLTFLESHPQYR